MNQEVNSKKVLAGILGILIGGLGIHKFVLGYTGAGLVMLLVSVLTCGIGWIVMGGIGFIEGVIYLSMPDDVFEQTYMHNRKPWF